MKATFIIFILITFTKNIFAEEQCNITDHYSDFIKIERQNYDGKEYTSAKIVEANEKNCFAELVNKNQVFMDYLLSNFIMDSVHFAKLEEIYDTANLQTVFINSLKNDSLYNYIMSELVAKTINKKIIKDTVSMEKLLNFAVKFFYVLRINEDGNYILKFCSGINAINQTEKKRQPYIEAFCFSAILNHYGHENEFDITNEFVSAAQELYKLNLGIDSNEQLLRAQGAMFMLMRNNDILKNLLINEYEHRKNYLPFILIY